MCRGGKNHRSRLDEKKARPWLFTAVLGCSCDRQCKQVLLRSVTFALQDEVKHDG